MHVLMQLDYFLYDLREHKKSLEETLKAWERKFNAVYPNCKPLTVENDVDLEAPPENFQ